MDILTQHPVPFRYLCRYTTPNTYPTSMRPTQTMVYCYTWKTHPLSIWSHGYQGVTINKYTVIKASASDFGLLLITNIIESHFLDFLTRQSFPQEGAQISAHQDLQSHEGAVSSLIPPNQKLCSYSPSQENKKSS